MISVQYSNSRVLLRDLNHAYPTISYGTGVYLFDKSGFRYLDGSAGAMVVSVGHGNQEVVSAISAQLSRVAYVNGMQFTSEPAERLATRLIELARPLGLGRATFLGSGSEAVEAAIKFIRQLWVERNKPARSKLIARVPCYHGNTLYALSVSSRAHYKKFFGPLLQEVVTVSAPYEYRSQVEDYQNDGAGYYAAELETTIQRVGGHNVMALLIEPIIGSSAGGSLPPRGYFDRVQEICKRHSIPIIADEILCGSGRTGTFFASEHFGLKPDVVVLGKGLGSGYAPLSAVLVREEDVAIMKESSGYFMHAQTYMQAPCMVAAGVAVLEYFEKHGVMENCVEMGEILHQKLRDEILPLPHVGFVTGKGLLAGVEFVEDKKTKKPFGRAKKMAEQFIAHAFKNGLILWPNVGHADGVNGDLVLISPPLIIRANELDEMVALFHKTITEFFGGWK